MNFRLIFLLTIAAFLFACSGSDDNKPAPEQRLVLSVENAPDVVGAFCDTKESHTDISEEVLHIMDLKDAITGIGTADNAALALFCGNGDSSITTTTNSIDLTLNNCSSQVVTMTGRFSASFDVSSYQASLNLTDVDSASFKGTVEGSVQGDLNESSLPTNATITAKVSETGGKTYEIRDFNVTFQFGMDSGDIVFSGLGKIHLEYLEPFDASLTTGKVKLSDGQRVLTITAAGGNLTATLQEGGNPATEVVVPEGSCTVPQ